MRALALRSLPCGSVFELIAEGATREVAIDLTLALAVAADDEPAGQVGEADAVVGLVGLLPTLAPAACEMLFDVAGADPPLLHAVA